MSNSVPLLGSLVNEKQNVGSPMIFSSGCDSTAARMVSAVEKISRA